MQYVRFRADRRWRFGLLEGDRVAPLAGSIFSAWKRAGKSIPLVQVLLGPPCLPSKIVAVGVNYRSHALEMGHLLPPEPKIFLKPATAVIGPGAAIRCPAMSAQVEYEAELGVVIAHKTNDVSLERALDHVLGYTCVNDVTARDLQKRDGQWTRAKSFDSFAPIGPVIATDLNPARLRVEAYLNGQKRQSGRTADLIFGVPQLVSFISRVMTLLPGDVIATGTPSGVGPLMPGDEIEIRITGIGSLFNSVSGW